MHQLKTWRNNSGAPGRINRSLMRHRTLQKGSHKDGEGAATDSSVAKTISERVAETLRVVAFFQDEPRQPDLDSLDQEAARELLAWEGLREKHQAPFRSTQSGQLPRVAVTMGVRRHRALKRSSEAVSDSAGVSSTSSLSWKKPGVFS